MIRKFRIRPQKDLAESEGQRRIKKNPAAQGRRDPHGNKDGKMQKAPVKKGEKAGTVSYYLADEKIAENVVVTERAVEKRTWEKCMKIVAAKFLTLESLVWYVKYV